MNPLDIINQYYQSGTRLYQILVNHGQLVAKKALEAASRVEHLSPDREFIWEAAMLHDIGMAMTHLPKLGCSGNQPYICHGILGRVLLEKHGLFRHAMVCERHVGVGLTAEDIEKQRLMLPPRDMIPVTIEEQIICYADKFFSKSQPDASRHGLDIVINDLRRFGEDKVKRFLAWHAMFKSG